MDLEYIDKIKLKLEKNIGNSLYNHCLRTAYEAEKLAKKHGINEEKSFIAGLLHDCGKQRFDKNDKNDKNDNLIHSQIGADKAKEEYKILDEDIINSIKYHTTGRENMSLLEKIIFIADKIEPNRNYEGVDELRKLAYDNINESIKKSLESTINYVKQRGFELDEQSLKTLDYLISGGNKFETK